jgi:thiamine biosynthesis lipoprotein
VTASLPLAGRRNRRVALGVLIWLACSRSAFATDCMSDGRYVMGTILEITLCTKQTAFAQQPFESLFATATFWDSLLTTYNPNSPVSRLNAHAGHGPLSVPQQVVDLLVLSRQFSQLTQGTFDITVGPLMAMWRETAQRQGLPSQQVLRQARGAVGSNHIRLFPNHAVALNRPGMAIDFGGIGKGYALDQLVSQLKQLHIYHALLDFGQSRIWAVGTPSNAEGWRILVQQSDGHPVGILTLRDQALSISASMGQSFEINGQRYGHIIDPRTGYPLQRDLLACVIAPTATQAEALSKALLILGEHEGLALLQRLPGVEGMLVEMSGGRWMTPGWQQAVAFALSEPVP